MQQLQLIVDPIQGLDAFRELVSNSEICLYTEINGFRTSLDSSTLMPIRSKNKWHTTISKSYYGYCLRDRLGTWAYVQFNGCPLNIMAGCTLEINVGAATIVYNGNKMSWNEIMGWNAHMMCMRNISHFSSLSWIKHGF
jgi:hypothetical protein